MIRRSSWLVLPLLGGCFLNRFTPFGLMPDRTSDWFATGTVNKPLPELAQEVRDLVLKLGYSIPSFDAQSGRIESDWDVRLSPEWREGTRSMVEVEISPAPSGGYAVRVRSSLEVNENQSKPMNADGATWVGAGVSEKHKAHIPEPAMRLNTMLKLRFFGMNP